jgi:outer membrane protein insertion porin family
MKVHALILVLLVPWYVHAEPQFYGTRVSGLALMGAESQADLQLLPIHVGDSVTPDNIRTSIQALYNTGRYSSIEVDAQPTADGGSNLTFIVRPYYFFATFRLEPTNLLERGLSAYSRLPLGEKFSESAVERVIEETKELLKSNGYFEATIEPQYDFDDTTRLASVTLKADPGPRAKVGVVRIQGGEQTFPHEELLDALGIDTGDDFSSNEVETGVGKVREKFSDLGFLNTRVNVDQPYSTATHSIDLNMTVEPGQFTLVETRGYNISSRNLRELVPVYEEGSVDPDLVEEGRVGLDRYLRQLGYFEAEVSSEIIEAPLDNAIQINYTIVPGVRHRIEEVRIVGNKAFSTDEIRNRIRVRKGQLFNRGSFSAEIQEEDIRTIEALYRSAGYEGTTVVGAYEEQDHAVTVVLQIDEGRQLGVDLVSFLGNDAISEQQLRDSISLKEGDIYTPPGVDQARAAITQLYFSRGFPDVRVEPIVTRIETNNGMGITFQISEGESYKVGQILISGNTLTKEKIIRRNSRLYEGMPYNPEELLESQQRLYATGLFNRVEIVPLQQNLPGIRNLIIQVEDTRPILLTYGLGYQEFERARGTVEVSHSNLFGLDRSISIRLRGSRREQRLQTTFREPWLFNHPLDGFASFFMEHTERPFFTASRIDFSFQALKRFSPAQNLLFTSSYQTVNLQDIRVNPFAERFPEERGVIQIARVGSSFIQDHRNDPINPTSGSFHTTTFQVASRLLGSEVNFTSLFNQSSFYSPAPKGVLATSVRLGWNQPFGMTEQLPITERYFAGGSTTLRGFDLDRAGTGNALAIANVEYRIPLPIFPISGIGGALFYDTGNAFAKITTIRLSEFTHTVGFGIRYQTPLGPARLDFGFNMKPRKQLTEPRTLVEERVQVFFTLGNPF